LLEDYEQYAARAKLMTSIHSISKKDLKNGESQSKIVSGILTSSSTNNNSSPTKRLAPSVAPTDKVTKKVDKKGLRRL
jgi:hypothetical protein